MERANRTPLRVLLIGAETPAGRALAAALSERGARFVLVASRPDPDVAFAVQRLGRRSGAVASQAIDATNEMAVRVMVRQSSKALGGLDAVIFAADLGDSTPAAIDIAMECSNREFRRSGGGTFIAAVPQDTPAGIDEAPPGFDAMTVVAAEDAAAVARRIVEALAGESS